MQKKVAASPMEAEYISAEEAVKEVKYLTTVLTQTLTLLNINDVQISKLLLFTDNSAAENFITKGQVSMFTCYIDLDFSFVRGYYIQGLSCVTHTSTKVTLAAILTKSVSKDLFL